MSKSILFTEISIKRTKLWACRINFLWVKSSSSKIFFVFIFFLFIYFFFLIPGIAERSKFDFRPGFCLKISAKIAFPNSSLSTILFQVFWIIWRSRADNFSFWPLNGLLMKKVSFGLKHGHQEENIFKVKKRFYFQIMTNPGSFSEFQ